jgi:hypothetical protein
MSYNRGRLLPLGYRRPSLRERLRRWSPAAPASYARHVCARRRPACVVAQASPCPLKSSGGARSEPRRTTSNALHRRSRQRSSVAFSASWFNLWQRQVQVRYSRHVGSPRTGPVEASIAGWDKQCPHNTHSASSIALHRPIHGPSRRSPHRSPSSSAFNAPLSAGAILTH